MDAGDCPNCVEVCLNLGSIGVLLTREQYYRVVGPMPYRAGAPLWKSPTSSPTETSRPGCKCSKDNGERDEARDDDIISRQQAISRHRHHFPAPKTPPGYWDIGFPDTQQVKEIKKAAELMHEHKERGMEMEARKPDGKYRRR